MINRFFYITSMPSSRKADIYLGYGDGEVFIDLNFNHKRQLYLKRISFDGYGCCDVNGNQNALTTKSTLEIVRQIEEEELDQKIVRSAILWLIDANNDMMYPQYFGPVNKTSL